jgi:predicted Zn-dependent protease
MSNTNYSVHLSQLLESARQLHREGKTRDAIKMLENNDAFAASARLLSLTAHFYYLLEHYDTAAASARRALEIDSKNLLALTTLGETDMKAGQYADAEIWFREAIITGPRTPHPYLRLAASLLSRQKYTEASEVLYKGLETFSGDIHLLERLQYALTMDARIHEAGYIRDVRRRHETTDAPDIQALLNRFEALEKPRAISQLKLLASMDHYKHETALHDRLAHLLIEENRFPEAIQHLENVLEQQPRNTYAKLNLALCLFKTNCLKQAWDIVNSIKAYRNDNFLKYVTIQGLIMSDKYGEALAICIHQLERNPRNKQFRKLLKLLKNKGANLKSI